MDAAQRAVVEGDGEKVTVALCHRKRLRSATFDGGEVGKHRGRRGGGFGRTVVA
jgi:hypothetical protein